jgi:hypothetical protein
MGSSGMTTSKPGGTRLALLAGLTILLGAMVVGRFTGGPSEATADSLAPATDGTTGAGVVPDEEAKLAPRTINWPLSADRDPFSSQIVYPPPPPPPQEPAPLPPAEAAIEQAADRRAALLEEARSSIALEAIMAGERPLAVINGRACRIGHEVNGFRIVDVQSDHVILEREGVRLAIRANTDSLLEGSGE